MTLDYTYNVGMVLDDKFMAKYRRIFGAGSFLDCHFQHLVAKKFYFQFFNRNNTNEYV